MNVAAVDVPGQVARLGYPVVVSRVLARGTVYLMRADPIRPPAGMFQSIYDLSDFFPEPTFIVGVRSLFSPRKARRLRRLRNLRRAPRQARIDRQRDTDAERAIEVLLEHGIVKRSDLS